MSAINYEYLALMMETGYQIQQQQFMQMQWATLTQTMIVCLNGDGLLRKWPSFV